MNRLAPLVVLAAISGASAPPASAEPLPTRVGQCVTTRIKEIANRLENTPGSGSLVLMANGGAQVSYDQIPAIDRSRPGDPVSMCLAALPQGCPRGDERGKIYRTTNLRTHASWRLPDSEHGCGGA